MSGLPPLESVSARRPPSGENAGAPLMPLLLDTCWRDPVARSWMKIDELPLSNELYARRLPSGDHAGDSSGSRERTTTCGLKPSESATISAYWMLGERPVAVT